MWSPPLRPLPPLPPLPPQERLEEADSAAARAAALRVQMDEMSTSHAAALTAGAEAASRLRSSLEASENRCSALEIELQVA